MKNGILVNVILCAALARSVQAQPRCSWLDFSPDGKSIAAVYDFWDGEKQSHHWEVQVLNVADGSRRARFQGDAGSDQPLPLEAKFSPNGQVLVGTGVGETLWFWDLVAGKLVKRVSSPPKPGVRLMPWGLHFIGSDRLLTTPAFSERGNSRTQAVVWDVATQKQRLTAGSTSVDGLWTGAAVSPDRKLCALSSKGKVSLLDTSKWTTALGPWPGRTATFSADGTRVAVCADRTIQIRTVPGGQLLRQINRQGSIGGAVGFAKNNRVLVVEQGYPLDFYDIQTGKRIARVDRRQYMARMVGEELAVAGEDGTISLLEAATGKSISQTPGVGAMAASPDGKWLVVGKQDGSLDLLDLATHTVIKTFPVP